MTPAGYMAKNVMRRPESLHAPQVIDIYSVSGCMSKDFADYVEDWRHNGYWLFNSPNDIKEVAKKNSVDLDGTSLFYYEVYENEFDGKEWHHYFPEKSFPTNVSVPVEKRLEGFDVATFWARALPECSPLSCNSLAEELRTNTHCLFDSFGEAESRLNSGAFRNAEPGPYRIFAVYSVNWS
jgi:hypothetical protein